MARGGQRDSRETFFINSQRFKNLGETPQAPQLGTLELYFREKVLYRLEDNGVETPIGGFGSSASPGFTWGRYAQVDATDSSPHSPNGEYLLNDGVPSNNSGRLVPFVRPIIKRVLLVRQDTGAEVKFRVQEHNGVNYKDLTEVGIPAGARTATHSLSIVVTSGRQLAVKIVEGSALRPIVGVILDGLY